MSDYAEGDFVEAVKGRTRISGVLSTDFSGLRIADAGWSIESLKYEGFTVTVIERAKPALPDVPGTVISWKAAYFTGLAVLEKANQWLYNGVNLNNAAMLQEIEGNAFTRLAPVPETAKKVLDAVVDRTVMHCDGCNGHLRSIAAEFGVTWDAGLTRDEAEE